MTDAVWIFTTRSTQLQNIWWISTFSLKCSLLMTIIHAHIQYAQNTSSLSLLRKRKGITDIQMCDYENGLLLLPDVSISLSIFCFHCSDWFHDGAPFVLFMHYIHYSDWTDAGTSPSSMYLEYLSLLQPQSLPSHALYSADTGFMHSAWGAGSKGLRLLLMAHILKICSWPSAASFCLSQRKHFLHSEKNPQNDRTLHIFTCLLRT